MDLNLPQHLEATRQLLNGSLRMRPSECPPGIPDELLQDLSHRFAPTQRLVVEPPKHSISLASRIRSFFATPAIGAAAIIAMVLSISIPGFLSTDNQKNGFRGNPGAEFESTPIFLTGCPSELVSILATTGDFAEGALVNIESTSAAFDTKGAKVIVDFERNQVLSIDADGRTVARAVLPEDVADLSLAIAKAVSQL